MSSTMLVEASRTWGARSRSDTCRTTGLWSNHAGSLTCGRPATVAKTTRSLVRISASGPLCTVTRAALPDCSAYSRNPAALHGETSYTPMSSNDQPEPWR